jgi:hypothetical protein
VPPPSDAIAWYNANVASAAARFEARDATELNGWLLNLLPQAPAVIMDVGAGSGRDAAWLASLGYKVWLSSRPLSCAPRQPGCVR